MGTAWGWNAEAAWPRAEGGLGIGADTLCEPRPRHGMRGLRAGAGGVNGGLVLCRYFIGQLGHLSEKH